MRLVSPCTTQYLKRSVKRYSVWIVAEVDAMHSKRLLACSNYLGGACGYQIPPIHYIKIKKEIIMITITSDGANKLLKKLETEKQIVLNSIDDLSVYIAAVTEQPEELKPKFDFCESMKRLEDLNDKIIRLRHARNMFNLATKLKNGMTIDQALIKLAMLNKYVEKIKNMSTRQEKSRVRSSGFSARSNEIEYQYINYNLDDAKGKYEEIVDEIMSIQEELNLINTTLVFDVDINL